MSLETEVFAGIKGKFMGTEVEALVGFTASVGATYESVKSKGFGVELSVSGDSGGTIAKYRVSAYLLKARNNTTNANP